jgi:hypothetical protein
VFSELTMGLIDVKESYYLLKCVLLLMCSLTTVFSELTMGLIDVKEGANKADFRKEDRREDRCKPFFFIFYSYFF